MAVRKRLGEMLLEAGVIDQNQLDAALGHQRKWGGRLGQALVDLKLTDEAHVVEALSRKFGYEVVRLEGLESGPLLESALKLLPREVASRHNVLPYAADTSTVSVAMADPGNIAVVDEIRFRAGRRVKVALAGDREIAAAVRRFYYPGEKEPAPISLELDEDGASGETVVEQFGGGSSDALSQFFAAPSAPAAAAPEPAAGSLAAPASAPPGGSPLPDAVELEDFLTPAPAPLRAVEAVASTRAPAAVAPAAPATPPPKSAPVEPGKTAPAAPAKGASAKATSAAPAKGASSKAAPAALAKAAPAAPATPAPVAPAGGVGRGAAEEPAEKSGTLELPLDAEIPPDAAGDDLWSQGPVRGPVRPGAQASPQAAAGGPSRRARPGSAEREVEILGAIDQLAQGKPVAPELVKPSQLGAALLRLLIRKKLISFEEFLDEFGKK